MKQDFTDSLELLKKYRENQESGITGLMNWEIEHENFILRSYNHVDKGAIIVQIWPNGNGFHIFETLPSKDLELFYQAACNTVAKFKTFLQQNHCTQRDDGSYVCDSVGVHDLMGHVNGMEYQLNNSIFGNRE